MGDPDRHQRTDPTVTVDVGGAELAGTAVVPLGDGPRPGALLLSGSGPLDRDSNTEDQRLDVSSTLAAALAAVGVATLRFDKRGVAASSGDFLTAGFHDEADDAAAALAALRGVDGVDPDNVGVIGHSVGATIAARLAARVDGTRFAVLIACAASPGAEVMAWQTDRIASGLPGPSWALGRAFRWSQARNLRRLDDSDQPVLRVGRTDQPAKWMREYRAHEPLDDLTAVECPVLAITGGKDIQVDPLDLARIEAAVAGPCTTHAPPDLTHVLRTSPHPPSITRYRELLNEPVDDDLVESVVAWTVERTGPTSPTAGSGDSDGN